MDSIIPLGQKNTLAEYMILSGADNRLPMLDKDLYDSWKKNGVTRTKKYVELSAAEKIQADCDMKATNIILQGLPADIYSLVNHHRVAKDLWERVQLLMQGTSLTKQERECKLYDAFDKFTHIKGETLHKYYLRFTQLINDMNIYNMKMEQFQVNTKFLNSLPPEWSKFVTDVKLVKDLHTTNFDQLHAYLEQHELYANEVRLAVMIFSLGDDPIAFLNKAMAFLTAVASSSNATSSGGNNASRQAMVVKCYNCQGEDIWLGNALSLSDQGMQHDGQIVHTIILNNAAFQTEDLDTYDSDCDDLSNAQAVLMANISNYISDGISEVPHSETYLNDMKNQNVHAMQDFEQPPAENVQDTHLQAQQDSMILSVIEQMSKQMINHVNNWEKANKEQNNESVTAELERYKERVKTLEQRLNIDLSSREKMIDSQMDDMIKEKLALKEQVDSLEQNLSKQIKEKECLLQTFTVFKSESKEKEDKYMENEIDLEKKIKELDNILFKVGQSAQTVQLLQSLQAFL
ncbi:hypothetical protein Tco_0691939 [Tanacetum coccineum]